MASRTPPLQGRSQFHSHWGEFASAAALPNGSGAPLPATQFVLQAGDLAYVTGSGVYYCVSPGVAGGADAVWTLLGSPIPAVPYVEGLAASGYQALSADMPGGDAFTVSVLVCLENMDSSGDLLNYRDGVGGYRLWYDGQFRFEVVTAGGVRTVSFNPNVPNFGSFSFLFPRKWVMFTGRHTGDPGSSLTGLFANGYSVSSLFSATSGVYVPPVAGTPNILVGQGGVDPALSTRLEGVAYSTAFLTSTQIATLFDATYHAGQIVQSGGLITRGWSAKSNTPGATWAPSIGAASDLTRIGAALPAGVETYPLWL